MKAHRTTSSLRNLLAVGGLCLLLAASLAAQDTSAKKDVALGTTTKVEVERGEVVNVSGDTVTVKMDTGEFRMVTPPPGTTAMVDGKMITVKDLKPGMRLEKAVFTTTTDRQIVTTRLIEGKVWYVAAPSTVILQFPDGQTKKYNIPKGQMFDHDGEKVDAFHLQKGMNIKATVITTEPYVSMQEEIKRSGVMPPPPVAPAADLPVLTEAPTAMAMAETAPAVLPKTGSVLPLIGLLGLLATGASFGLRKLKA